MSFFFKNHSKVDYELGGKTHNVQNPLVRFKLHELLKDKVTSFMWHDLRDGQTPEVIAEKYYGDSTLDWVIFLTNDIYDTSYDLPLDYNSFTAYIINKYSSVETAMGQIDHYEQVIQKHEVLPDGTVVPERSVVIDFNTYSTLTDNDRKAVDSYTHEERLMEKRRKIRVMKKEYLDQFLAEADSIFE